MSRMSLLKRNMRLLKKLSSPYFTAQSTNFIDMARALEELKTSSKVSDNIFRDGRFMFLLQSDLVCIQQSKLVWKNFQDMSSIISDNTSMQKILLDISSDLSNGNRFVFAINIPEKPERDVAELESRLGGKFVTSRASLLKLNESDCRYVAQAIGLAHFNKTFSFCPSCGHEVISNAIGNQKKCQNCLKIHYPYVAPVGIVLVEDHKHEKVLLVRQGRHPPGLYSCVAGFIEPGETLYEAVRREVAEEVGLVVSKVEFCSTKPWAMPSSQLMLACIATVENEEFVLDDKEIQNAQWVTAADLHGAISKLSTLKSFTDIPEKKGLLVPPPFTASYELMVEWLKKYHSL